MWSALGTVAIGLGLGLAHATDPDHLLAVSTLVSEQLGEGSSDPVAAGGAGHEGPELDGSHRSTVARTRFLSVLRIGVAWGLGHASVLLAFGSILLAFRWSVPERMALSLELLVGVMLVALGGATLSRTAHSHPAPRSPRRGFRDGRFE